MQAKLRVSQPHDPAEVEADRAADLVLHEGAAGPVKEGCDCGGSCTDCQEDEQPVLSRAAAKSPPASDTQTAGDAGVDAVIGGAGMPLPDATRTFFESRFGADLHTVRVHDDNEAARSAAGVSARAYTVGEHVAFDTGEYRPDAADGRRLLAHELVHVLQQRAAGPAIHRQEKPQGRTDVALVLDGDPISEKAASALAGKVVRVYDETDIRDKLKTLGPIGTLYVVSHSNAAGQVQFESSIGTIKWVKVGDIASVIKGSVAADKAPSLVDFRGCNLGQATDELGKFAKAVGAKSSRGTNCWTFDSAVGPITLNGSDVKKESDVTDQALFDKGMRQLIASLKADNGTSVRNCTIGLAPGETADGNLDKLKKQYFRNGGALVAEWVSPDYNKNWQPGSKCFKDLTEGSKPCGVVTASNEPAAPADGEETAVAQGPTETDPSTEAPTPIVVTDSTQVADESTAVA